MESTQSPSLTCRIAGLDCVVEPGAHCSGILHRFEPFLIPEWMLTAPRPVLSGMDASIIRHLAHRHPGWAPSRLEAESLCRTMFNGFARRGVIAIAGTCIVYHDRAYLFSSRYGGVSERHALLWRQYLGDDVRLLANGWVAVAPTRHERDDYAVASSTPWWSEWDPGEGITCPLEGWCFVEPDVQGAGNSVRRMDASRMVDEAMQCLFVPDASLDAARALSVLDRVMALTALYRERLRDDESAVAESFRMLTGRSYRDARSLFPLPPVVGPHAWG